MNKNEWKKWVGVVGRMLLAFALVFGQGAWAAQNQSTKDKAASPQKAAQQANEKQSAVAATAETQSKQAQSEESGSAVAEEKPSHDGSHQGVKVHGHWTIEVRNPDGKLITHREFENSLQRDGALFLAGCLVNGCGQPSWIIKLHATTSICSNSIFNNCDIPATAGVMGITVVVTMNFNATGAGSIDFVTSLFTPQGGLPVTFSAAPTGVAVSTGQLVAATVNFSFS